MGVEIPDLTTKAAPDGTDFLVINEAAGGPGSTKKTTVQAVADFAALAAAPVWGRSFADTTPTIQAGDGATEFDYATITIPAGTVKANSRIAISLGVAEETGNVSIVTAKARINSTGGTILVEEECNPGSGWGTPSVISLVAPNTSSFYNTNDPSGTYATYPVSCDFTADVDIVFTVFAETGDGAGLWYYAVEVIGGA